MRKNFKEFLNEASVGRVLQHTQGRNIGMITAHRGEYTASENKEPKQKFIARHHFEFLDCEPNGSDTDEFTMTQEQAAQIAKILFDAFESGLNVIVHCHAGHNRSGAIAQVGEVIGFEYVIPGKLAANVHVKSLIMAEFYRII